MKVKSLKHVLEMKLPATVKIEKFRLDRNYRKENLALQTARESLHNSLIEKNSSAENERNAKNGNTERKINQDID